ncbi:MAG: class III extradiol dioxygenase subunit B-like domain-containing protein [Patescibacteria group bacterium]|jgi:aromatic ring-opening dioxygenase LigB subunit
MPLVFAGITPHTPLILPSIGAEYIDAVKKTRAKMEVFAHHLYAAQPETLIIFTPHVASTAGVFTVVLAQTFEGGMDQFGDFSLKVHFPGDVAFAHRIQRRADEHKIPTALQHNDKLDYGSTVPLLFLEDHLPKLKIIPISDSTLDTETHFRFGELLREEIHGSTSRIAVLASADLTNRGKRKAYEIAEKQEPYDAAVLKALKNNAGRSLLEMPPTIPQDANECGFHSILMLFGLLDHMNYHATVHSYEAPIGVGFLVSEITPA